MYVNCMKPGLIPASPSSSCVILSACEMCMSCMHVHGGGGMCMCMCACERT